jgi:hypothetical protein
MSKQHRDNALVLQEKKYTPFVLEHDIFESLYLQEQLGFGRVNNLVFPDLRESDEELAARKQSNQLAAMFDCVDLRGRVDHSFYPHDAILNINNRIIPVFDQRGQGPCVYGNTRRQKSFQIRRYMINSLVKTDYECMEVDWTETPPEWAAIVFPNASCDYECISIQMRDEVQDSLNSELPENKKSALEWVSGLPQFPKAGLELALRAREISPSGIFMLIFKPDWKYQKVTLPELDPILLFWHDYCDHGNGNWFKVCEWGADQTEALL